VQKNVKKHNTGWSKNQFLKKTESPVFQDIFIILSDFLFKIKKVCTTLLI